MTGLDRYAGYSLVIGSDHAGFRLKEQLKEYLAGQHVQIEDMGTHSADSVDYPDIAVRVARIVSGSPDTRGILICGSGIGMSITANKIPGIRAALCTSEFHAEMSRRHNNANILALGERVTPFENAKNIVDLFLKTEFEGGRHQRRIDTLHQSTGC